MDQHIKRLATLGRHARISARRCRQIGGGVRRRLATLVDGVELLLRVAGEDEIMMAQMLIALVQAKIEHNARAGGLEALFGIGLAGRPADQFAIGANGVHIGDHRIARDGLARGQLHPAHGVVLDNKASDLGIGAQFSAQIAGQLGQAFGHRPGAALGVPDALGRLHIADGAQHGRRGIGVGADILHVVVEHLRHIRIRHMLADDAGGRAAHAQRHDILQHIRLEIIGKIQRIADPFDRLPEEEFFRHIMQVSGHVLEALIALAQAGRDTVHMRGHLVDIADQISLAAILEEAAPLRLQLDQRHVLMQGSAGLGENAAQHTRHGQDGRAHIEAEIAAAIRRRQVQHRRLAAEPWVLVQHGDPVPAGAGDSSGSQATQARTHHNHMRCHGVSLRKNYWAATA